MTQFTIPAQVVNGHLQHEQSLAELEGQQVQVTLTVAPKDAVNGTPKPAQTMPKQSEESDPEPPPWLEIEHDVYFPMTVPEKPLGKVKIHKRRGKPCIILPEELPDE
ncbi:MAG: hypothetical protein HY289_10610 [Planctomycetes bacterium]|nr:hypothetical protein [Planctomycetota bacterium]